MKKKYHIDIEDLYLRERIDLTSFEIDDVLRESMIQTWVKRLKSKYVMRIAGWRITSSFGAD